MSRGFRSRSAAVDRDSERRTASGCDIGTNQTDGTEMIRVRKVASFALAASAASAAMVATTATGASAAPVATCTDSYACIWQDYDYVTNGVQANFFRWGTYDSNLANDVYRNTTFGVDNSADSIHNNDDVYTTFAFQLDHCTGYSFSKSPNTTDGNFSNGTPTYSDGSSAHNRTSSVSFSTHMSSCI